ncbi:MAG: hypothetical protein FWF12_08850, partial [Betaproteobacteria bacterium]|nr:hypothetical protein [Betaproteobacteria bacterium]
MRQHSKPSISFPGAAKAVVQDMQTPQLALAEVSDMEEVLGLQYAAYQSEALIHGDFTIQPLMQTLAEIIEEHSKCVFLKAVLNDKII